MRNVLRFSAVCALVILPVIGSGPAALNAASSQVLELRSGISPVDQGALGNGILVMAVRDDGPCQCPLKPCVPGRCNCGGVGQPVCCDATCVTICIPWEADCCGGES